MMKKEKGHYTTRMDKSKDVIFTFILSGRAMVLLQEVAFSNVSQVSLKLALPVNLRPKPFSPSR